MDCNYNLVDYNIDDDDDDDQYEQQQGCDDSSGTTTNQNNSNNNNNNSSTTADDNGSVNQDDDDISQNDDNFNFSQNNNNNETEDDKTNEDFEEQQYFFDIINTFRYYKSAGYRKIDRSVQFINSMPPHHQEKLKNYRDHLEKVRFRILHNYQIIKVIIGDAADMFRNSVYLKNKQQSLVVKPEKDCDTDRINSVLNQIVREWTSQGASERDICMNPILKTLDDHFYSTQNRHLVKVLVPGAGLGRLAFEIAKRGYSCQGNEFSLMMMFVSNFILNKCQQVNSFTIYPWISHFSNNLFSESQLTSVTFPDVDPSMIGENVHFSMAAGSFTEIYNNPKDYKAWDCVATCFFLDTAPNIVAYIETIWNILKSNGIWINFGPLLYHYADMQDQQSIEPSYEIVREIILSFGFKFLNEQTNITSYYTRNQSSMLSYQYKSVFFTCQKNDTLDVNFL